MKALFERVDRLRLLALVLGLLPGVALLPLGAFWLWQSGWLSWWLAGLLGCGMLSYALQYALTRRGRRLLGEAATRADPAWPRTAEGAWMAVEQLADGVQPQDWPLQDGGRLWLLGQNALEAVAHHYHPQRERPLLELTVPHTLLIIERASRDLRATVSENVPFSHQLTLGDLMRAWRWKAPLERLLNVYRAGRLVLNPADAVISEAWGYARGQTFGSAWAETQRWLLREYVRKVGYYAIELYSGRLVLSEAEPTATVTPVSSADLQRAAENSAPAEPLRILVLGRANAGKSSLINALFGQLTAATDLLPDTTRGITPYRLERAGLTAALVFDTPGCDTELLAGPDVRAAACDADLLLWVCAAHRADRQIDRQQLDALRAAWAERQDRRPPPLLVALSHIDLLRPSREWQPPYDLQNPQGAKARNIRAALEVVATDLALPVDAVIPVCLAAERVYNVEDALWAALLDRQDEAGRVRLLRCLEQRRQAENWPLLRRQLINAGRLLRQLPGRMLGG